MQTQLSTFHQTELQKAIENADKGQNTFLISDDGLGKTVCIEKIHSQMDNSLYIETLSPPKTALMEIACQLHANGDLEIEDWDVEYLDKSELLRRIKRLNMRELLSIVKNNLSGKKCILLIDQLESLTPSGAGILETLLECATIIGAANKLKSRFQKLWWHFEQIELKPLTKAESRQLLWELMDKKAIEYSEFLENKIITQANGNPLAIKELAAKAMREENLTAEAIRNLRHKAGTRYIDITPVFFIFGFFAVTARFVALGMNSSELYILAAVASSFFMTLRYFLYRSMRKDE